MVAEAQPQVSTSRPKSKGRGNAPQIPLLTRIKAKNLYVGQVAPASEVARLTGLSVDQVYALASREGWSKFRSRVKLKAEESVNARAQRDIDALVEEVANDTAELSLGTLAKAKVTLERDDKEAARDLQAYSQAAKNFVGIYRQAKSLDAAAQQGNTTNVMFISCARVGVSDTSSPSSPASTEINVTPVPVEPTL